MENFPLHLVFLIIFVLAFSSFLYPIKEISKPFKIVIFLIGLNLFLTMLLPNYSLVNLLSLETKLDLENTKTTTNDFWSIRGQIGDLIAGHFTALAFIGILINIMQMRKSLDKQDEAIRIQQKEMQNQQLEMKATTKSLELQAKLIEKQNFENTFFKMLDLYINIQNNVKFKNYKKKLEVVGDEAFYEYASFWLTHTNNSNNLLLKNFNELNDDFMRNNHIYLSHYFRTLYRLIKFVHHYDDVYNQLNKKEYIKLIRAQLSSMHLLIIFCNCLYSEGNSLKKFVEEYAIFEHLIPMNIFGNWDLEIIKQFDIKAFGAGKLSDINNQKSTFYKEENDTTK